MTAPQQNIKQNLSTEASTEAGAEASTEASRDGGLSAGQRLQRCGLVAFGLMSSCGFVASQINLASAAGARTEGHSAEAAPAETANASREYAVESSYLEAVDAPLAVDTAAGTAAIEPAVARTVTSPTVTPIAAPAFSSEPKLTAKKAVYRSHPLVGMVEPGLVATPVASYVSTPVSTVSAIADVPEPADSLIASAASSTPAASSVLDPAVTASADSAAASAAIAQPEPAATPSATPAATPAAPSAPPAAPIVEISPEITPAAAAPTFTPASTPSPTANTEVTPAGVLPTEVVPAALPEGITRPGEYDSIFVDPTDYSVGATAPTAAPMPDVVVADQSSGCTFTVSKDQGVPNGACQTASPDTSTAEAVNNAAPVAGAAMPGSASSQVAASAASTREVNVGPVSFSASGIRLSTSAAGREYLNRAVRPVVNLQAAAEFIFPLSVPSPISSLFGFRIHPIFGDRRFHSGTDIAAPQGTPVLAAQDGIVTSSGVAGGYGLMVVLEHDVEETTLESRYAHLSEIFVESGNAVKKGDVVGLVGNTGYSTGPHLHFEMRQLTADGWVLVNPDGLIQASLARLVRVLNNPAQTISFDLSDFKLKNLKVDEQSASSAASSTALPPLPGQDGISYRPAQPNAS